jgi:hypothetical protein
MRWLKMQRHLHAEFPLSLSYTKYHLAQGGEEEIILYAAYEPPLSAAVKAATGVLGNPLFNYCPHEHAKQLNYCAIEKENAARARE